MRSSSESFRDHQPHSQCSSTDHSGDAGWDRLLSALPLQSSRRRHPFLLTGPAAGNTFRGKGHNVSKERKENDLFSFFASNCYMIILYKPKKKRWWQLCQAGQVHWEKSHTLSKLFSKVVTDGRKARLQTSVRMWTGTGPGRVKEWSFCSAPVLKSTAKTRRTPSAEGQEPLHVSDSLSSVSCRSSRSASVTCLCVPLRASRESVPNSQQQSFLSAFTHSYLISVAVPEISTDLKDIWDVDALSSRDWLNKGVSIIILPESVKKE